ncbi:MAG: hypothetical protein CAPSK01_002959 [Candidatus Accumulibacter vicinus]|uniref:Uncharacterized protein n=1 Tax=Candidatus Accumulibacter vicinus TaxID=2954382 RepID=A0A084XYH4_9PROT|nr:MAG: hypothetical protein CAPSK01_002959 [Candidatus Accumulibacter vicinus]
MILARSGALRAVAGLLAALPGRAPLRDTYRAASEKAGTLRAELDVGECWTPWWAWGQPVGAYAVSASQASRGRSGTPGVITKRVMACGFIRPTPPFARR